MSTADPSPHGERVFSAISLAIFSALIFFTIFHHEPWRDEGDVWLAARDMNILQLFHWSHYSGTPLLWYCLVMPLAKSGLPYQSMFILHGAVAIVTAGLVLRYAPFSRLIRLALTFSFFLSYEYAVVARNYAIIVLLAVIFAIQFSNRSRNGFLLGLILALMCSASVHGLMLAAGLCTAVCLEAIFRRRVNRQIVITALAASLGAAICLFQLYPVPPDRQRIDLPNGPNFNEIYVSTVRAAYPFAPVDFKRFADARGTKRLVIAGVLWSLRTLSGATFIVLAYSLRKRPYILAGLAVTVFGLLYVFIFHWYAGDRHAGMVWLTFLIAIWVSRLPNDESPVSKSFSNWHLSRIGRVLLTLSLAESCALAALFHFLDWRYAFSGAHATATYLASHFGPDDQAAVYPDNFGAALLPYLPGRKFWYPGRRAFGTFGLWDQNFVDANDLTDVTAMHLIEQALPVNPHLLVITTYPMDAPSKFGLSLVFQNTGKVFRQPDETYFVYRGNPVELKK